MVLGIRNKTLARKILRFQCLFKKVLTILMTLCSMKPVNTLIPQSVTPTKHPIYIYPIKKC